MSALQLARPDDIEKLLVLVAGFDAHQGAERGEAEIRAALAPVLSGIPHGAVYLVGPRVAPVGFVAVSFGHSIAQGGLTATIDALFIREKVRRRGMGTEVLLALAPALERHGIKALHLVAPDARTRRLCERAGFAAGPEQPVMTRRA